MIERFLVAIQRLMAGVFGVLVMFGFLISLVIWGWRNPETLQALVGKLADALVSLISWLSDQLVRALDEGGN